MRTHMIVSTLALAAALPLGAQERPRIPVVAPAVEHAIHVGVPQALAALEAGLPSALAALEVGVPQALTALEVTLPQAMAHLEMALPHALASLEHLDIAFDHDHEAFEDFDADAPEAWAPQDPADSLYRAARRALNAEEYSRAAQMFSRIHDEARFRSSEYRPLSYYYEALARSRMGSRAELGRAREALDQMRSAHPAVWRDQAEAASLLARVNSELARQGDETAVRAVTSRANASGCNETKIEALNALLQMDAANAMPILEEVMKNKSTDECATDMRRRAVFLISQKRTERSADILLDAAKNDPDSKVQEQAVFWLGQVSSDKAVDAIETILRGSPSRKLQEQAVFALSQHKSERAAVMLRDVVTRGNTDPEVRAAAIHWLGQRRGPENARVLRELYGSVNERKVKESIIFAISQIRGEESADWLLDRALDQNEDTELRKSALFWAGQMRTIPIAKLNELYDKMPSREMKSQLVFVLSQRNRDTEAVDLLIKIAREEKDPELRKNAIFWLGQSKDPKAAKFLLDLIKG